MSSACVVLSISEQVDEKEEEEEEEEAEEVKRTEDAFL